MSPKTKAKHLTYTVSQVWIGSDNPQSVVLDFDTGSSETWVSPPCSGESDFPESEELCRELGTYVPEQSFSAVDLNDTCPSHWLMYGSGSVFIRYYKDVIAFTGEYSPKAALYFVLI